MPIKKQPLYSALRLAKSYKGSVTIDTRNCEPINVLLPITGETLELPKGRITLTSSNSSGTIAGFLKSIRRALSPYESEDSEALVVKVLSCPEDVVFEQKVYKKEILMPTVGGYSIMKKEEIFEVGDIVSAEPSSDDFYGITTSRNGYMGKVESYPSSYSNTEIFNLSTYSRIGFSSSRGDREGFDVRKKHFRLSSAPEIMYGANLVALEGAKYVSGKGNSIILPIKDVHIAEGGITIGELSDGSTICLNNEVVFIDDQKETVENTISKMSAQHPLKSTGHREARRIF